MSNRIVRVFVIVTLLALSAAPILAAVRGVVVNDAGEPVQGARVALYALEASQTRDARWMSDSPLRVPLIQVATSSGGRFSAEWREATVVDIVVEADGFAPVARRVAADEEIGAVVLRRVDLVEGRVTSATKPVEGARLIWASDEGAEIVATSGSDGRFTVPNPAAWAARQVVVHASFSPRNALLRGGPAPLGISLETGRPLEGTIVTADGAAVENATIVVDGLSFARSGHDGRFRLEHIARDSVVFAISGGTLGQLSDSTVQMEPGASVSGVIRAAGSGGRVVDAEIRLRNLESGFVVSTLSSRDGAYSIGPLPPGTYQVEVVSPTWIVERETLSVDAGTRVEKSLIARAASTIEGSVAETGASAVAGATIVLDETVPAGIDSSRVAYTGPDGRFVIRMIGTEREFAMTMMKDGLPRVTSQPMQLPAGTRKRGVHIEVDRGVELTGRVVDRSGMELGGALVSAIASDEPMLEAAADTATEVSDSEGRFQLTLPRGKYTLEVSAAGYAKQTIADVVADQLTAPLRIVLAEATSISGVVRRSGGDAVGGVYVTGNAGATVETAVTDSEGRFTLSGIPEGRVELSAMKAEEFISASRVVTAPASGIVIEVGGGRSISGRVIDKFSGEPVTQFEIEIASATAVEANRYASAIPFATENGSFTIANPPDGAVQLLVRAEGYAAAKSDRLSLDDGKSLDDVQVELERGGSIQGRVVDASGVAVPDVEIRPLEPMVANDPLGAIMPVVEARSDAGGVFVIPEVTAGMSRILFRKTGYKVVARDVMVSGGVARLDVQLVPIGEPDESPNDVDAGSGAPSACVARVIGRVAGLELSALPGATVDVTTASTRQSARVDESGAFSVDVPAGAMSLVAELEEPGRTRMSRVVELAPGCGSVSTEELAFGDVVARGQVRRDGEAVVDAMVSFVPQDDPGSPRGTVRVDSHGAFELPGLAAGTYLAVVREERRLESFLAVVDMTRGGQLDIDLTGGSVSGRIESRVSGLPIAGAVVTLVRNGVAAATLTVLTNSEGLFVFAALPGGHYEISVEHERHGKLAKRVELRDNEATTVDLSMN